MAAKGQALVSDRLFGIRQRHPRQHHKSYEDLGNYKHWPLIIASPDFSNIFCDFKRCLRDAVSEIDRVDADEMDTILDEGLVSLVHRAAGNMPPPEAGDREMLERCNSHGTVEHARVSQVIAAIRDHPETI